MYYLIVEPSGWYTSGGITIHEIKLFDRLNQEISYYTTSTDVTSTYSYWDREIWGRTLLNDGTTNYNSGGSTSFWASTSESGVKGSGRRFTLFINSESLVTKISVWAGANYGPPENIKFYYTKNYNKQLQVINKQNTDLKLILNLNIPNTSISTEFSNNVSIIDSKYLFYKDNKTYYFDNTNFIELGTLPFTKLQFDDYGINSLESLNKALLGQVSSIYCCSYDSNTTKTLSSINIPLSNIIESENISLSDSINIDSFTITGSNTNSSLLKIMVSPNNGDEWYTYKNNIWATYSLTKNNMTVNGMTITEFNLVNINFNQILNNDKKLKLAFLLDLDLITDTLSVNTLSYQVDIKGSYEQQTVNTTYKMVYASNNNLLIKILEPGTFKINY